MEFTSSTWGVLSALLDEALELDAAARTEWLQRITTKQPGLAPLLSRLLAAHATKETADVLSRLPQLDTPALKAGDIIDLKVAALIGPYRLLREIGSGGMADVWLAERADGAFERQVALKLPRLTSLRRDLASRFAHERNILARLEHPHIARFYDAGVTADGLPYLAMEYVSGRPLTLWCKEHRLTTAMRLALFAQVLDAVQFAHANLVIHRDLKPSNILVTNDGQVRLLDFGIAKLLSDGESARETRLTQLVGRALTPDYASPEQIKGDPLTIASDVYSLGVVLHELLTGELPYRLKLQSVAQLEQAIVSAEPIRPSRAVTAEGASASGVGTKRLSRTLRGDLDTIVLKALAKQPAHRYGTIAEFAEDLQRHLTGQPVQARPASFGYRTRKFIARNRLAVGATTAISVALIAATVVSLWQAQRERELAVRAQQQATRAEDVKKFVLSFFQAADPESGGSRQTTALDLLKQARERLNTAQISDDAIRAELLTTIGSGLYGLGETKLAVPVLAEATHLAVTKLGKKHPTTAQAEVAYGLALQKAGDARLAAAQFDAAEEVARRTGDMPLLTAALTGQADLRHMEGHLEAAIQLYRDAAGAAERQPDRRVLVQAYVALSDGIRSAHYKGALEPAQRAYQIARELYTDRPTPLLIEAHETYAEALEQEGRADEALTQLRSILDQKVSLLGPEHPGVSSLYRNIGALLLRQGDPNGAIDSLREAQRIDVAQGAGKPTEDLAFSSGNLGAALANAHRYDEALVEWRKSEAAFSAVFGADSLHARFVRGSTAIVLTKLGRLDEADAIFTQLLRQPFNRAETDAFINSGLGRLRSAQGRHTEAVALLRKAVEYFLGSEGAMATGRQAGLALGELGDALLAAGQPKESLEALQQARALLQKTLHNGSPDMADIAVDIARAKIVLGHPDEAVPASAEAVAFWDRFDRSNRDSGLALLWHARALHATGRVAESAESLHQARDILAVVGRPGDRALLSHTEHAARVLPTALR